MLAGFVIGAISGFLIATLAWGVVILTLAFAAE